MLLVMGEGFKFGEQTQNPQMKGDFEVPSFQSIMLLPFNPTTMCCFDAPSLA